MLEKSAKTQFEQLTIELVEKYTEVRALRVYLCVQVCVCVSDSKKRGKARGKVYRNLYISDLIMPSRTPIMGFQVSVLMYMLFMMYIICHAVSKQMCGLVHLKPPESAYTIHGTTRVC